MKTDETLLNVGDKVVVYNYGAISRVITVDRVTATQAICGNTKLKRTVSNGYIRGFGGSSFGGLFYFYGNERRKSRAINANVSSVYDVKNGHTLN
jgi:hypothetical protein